MNRRLLAPLAAGLFAFACSDSGSSVAPDSTTSQAQGGVPVRLFRAYNGFGNLLPYQTEELNVAGFPTGQTISLRQVNDFERHVSPTSPIFAPPPFPAAAVDVNGNPSNHFFAIRFTSAIDPASIFDLSTGGLTSALSLTTIAPATGVRVPVPARVLVGGVTVESGSSGFALESWGMVDPDNGLALALHPELDGLPSGTNAGDLLRPETIVVIADSDGDLSTLETFPLGSRMDLRMTTGIRSLGGGQLEDPALASTTVGSDLTPPRIANNLVFGPDVMPSNGATGVDPETDVVVNFEEPVNPTDLGLGFGLDGPQSNSAISMATGTGSPIFYETTLESPYDLTRFVLTPVVTLPGEPASGPSNLNLIRAGLTAGALRDLGDTANTAVQSWSFRTGPGAGFVNAPVVPEAILALGSGASGDTAMVLDLNGFGASTGNPASSLPFPLEGESRFPYDPNVSLNPAIRPILLPGTTTLDGGSAGVFTLTRDSNLSSSLVADSTFETMDDAHVGHALDYAFDNAPPPFGCQFGGGDLCVTDGLKLISPLIVSGGLSLEPAVPPSFSVLPPGFPNLVSWAPHPNPPPLASIPLCFFPSIPGRSPSQVNPSITNLLVPGNPFPDPVLGTPPTGKLSVAQNAFFGGPTVSATQLSQCFNFFVRQQIGHFIYVADRSRNELVVLNSNTMAVVERIAVADPVDMAMSPNLDVLVLVSQLADRVVFVDINPVSAQFHQIINVVSVGDSPNGAAYSPDNEAVYVCNEGDGTLSVIDAASLQVRQVASVPSGTPFQVMVTERETGFGLDRGVHYAYILDRNGALSVYESGPDGPNGWGYETVIGELPWTFQAPKAIQPDLEGSGTAFVVAHEGPIDPVTGAAGALGDGAITRVDIASGQSGLIPLVAGVPPGFRNIDWGIVDSLSESGGTLSGLPVDVAFDEMINLGGLPGDLSIFGAGSPLPANTKGLRRMMAAGGRAVRPRFLLAAIEGAGVIDVVENGALFDTNPYAPGIQSVPAPGVRTLVNYWRQ